MCGKSGVARERYNETLHLSGGLRNCGGVAAASYFTRPQVSVGVGRSVRCCRMSKPLLQIVRCAFMASLLSCSRHPAPQMDAMSTGWCDTTPMKPIGLPVAIPTISAHPDLAAVTGSVVQSETGDALYGATINLTRTGDAKPQSQRWLVTDSKGGFAFDSVAPGRYQLKVRRVGVVFDTLTVRLGANKVDTVRFRLRAYRCYGY